MRDAMSLYNCQCHGSAGLGRARLGMAGHGPAGQG